MKKFNNNRRFTPASLVIGSISLFLNIALYNIKKLVQSKKKGRF